MLAQRQISWVEEGLDLSQLRQRIRGAFEWSVEVGKLQYKSALEQATPDQRKSWERVWNYFTWLQFIAEYEFELRVMSELEPLSLDERRAKLLHWGSMSQGSLSLEKAQYYGRHESTQEVKDLIEYYRSGIAEEALAVMEGLRAFGVDRNSGFWPTFSTADSEVLTNSTSATDKFPSACLGPANSSLSGEMIPSPPYLDLIKGHITILRSAKVRAEWDDVAKRIIVGDAEETCDATDLLPHAFRACIGETRFSGSLFDFIRGQDEERKKKIRTGHGPETLFDFKGRFRHRFSDAMVALGLGRKLRRKSKV